MMQTNTPDDLPLLTEVVEVSDPLPILTEIVTAPPPAAAAPPESAVPVASATLHTAEEVQQLLQRLEAHLETVFTSRLNSQLEQLQRLAVNLAVSEFKAELPQLLRDALKNDRL